MNRYRSRVIGSWSVAMLWVLQASLLQVELFSDVNTFFSSDQFA